MSPEALLAELSPIRLPVSFAQATVNDALLALSLGLLAGLALAWVIGRVTMREVSLPERVQSEIEALAGLAKGRRLVGLAALLEAHAPGALAEMGARRGLYDPSVDLDPAVLEDAILRAVKGRKG